MRRIPLILLLWGMAFPAPAQEVPGCGPARQGEVACLSGRLCACRFTRGGSLTGLPDRHAWDCGILRPACGTGLVPPSGGGDKPVPVPNLFLQLPGTRQR
jgi:hypothetical protein